MVDELLGGVCVECWGRLNNYIQDSRIENGRDSLSEWFQWLAERLQEIQALSWLCCGLRAASPVACLTMRQQEDPHYRAFVLGAHETGARPKSSHSI